MLYALRSWRGFSEHVSRHARNWALEESNNALLDMFLERVDAEVDVLAPRMVGRLRHELARAVVFVEGSRASLLRSTALEEA